MFYTYNSSHTSIYKAESDGDIEGYAAVKCMASYIRHKDFLRPSSVRPV